VAQAEIEAGTEEVEAVVVEEIETDVSDVVEKGIGPVIVATPPSEGATLVLLPADLEEEEVVVEAEDLTPDLRVAADEGTLVLLPLDDRDLALPDDILDPPAPDALVRKELPDLHPLNAEDVLLPQEETLLRTEEHHPDLKEMKALERRIL